MAKKIKTFRVEGFIRTWTDIEVSADSLENAAAAARGLSPDDFIEYHGECIDHSLQIIAVRDEGPEING